MTEHKNISAYMKPRRCSEENDLSLNISQMVDSSENNMSMLFKTLDFQNTPVATRRSENFDRMAQENISQAHDMLLQASKEDAKLMQLSYDEMKESYESQIKQLVKECDMKCRDIHAKYNMDKALLAEVNQVKMTNRVKEQKQAYEIKLSEFEALVQQAKNEYKKKELRCESALSESRRELKALVTSFGMKEECLREELHLKDQRLHSIQHDIQKVHDTVQEKEYWRMKALELSGSVIRLCSTANEVSDRTGGVLSSYDFEGEKSKENVLVNRKLVVKCLKISKVQLLFLYFLLSIPNVYGKYVDVVYCDVYIVIETGREE